MDSGALSYLQGYLPDPFLALVYDKVLRDSAPARLWASALVDRVSDASAALVSVATPLLDRVTHAAYNAPDVVVLLLVVVLIVLMLQVLSMMRRLLAWWTRLLLRLIFWGGVALVVALVWQRGLEQAAQDAAAIAGRLHGYATWVGDIWQTEYARYQQQQMQAQAANFNTAAGGGGRIAGSGWSKAR